MRAAEPGRRPIGRWSGRPLDEPARGLVRLVTRLVVAQAIASAAIGLPFSRRQLPSILITLAMVAALCGLADTGRVLLAADYSQIELRLMAHFSEDPLLLRAYTTGQDIHTLTASQVFGIPPLMVAAEHRRRLQHRPGGRVEVRRGETPVRLVRLHEAPFTDRLVAKFGLPVQGWRGSAERAGAPGTKALGRFKVLRKEDMDGIKLFLDAPTNGNGAEAWVLLRASGTEPLLRIYSEAAAPGC